MMKTLADAFVDELRDALNAERQLIDALPKMAASATNEQLTEAFREHLEETRGHVERVEQAFAETGQSPSGKICNAMKGLITEAQQQLAEEAEPAVKDAIIIACAQKVEHYEIATYGTLCTWAEILGYDNALKLLKQNIQEEETADKRLTEVAKSINREAVSVG
jgi:ferritin-like metal-binding protein YciE